LSDADRLGVSPQHIGARRELPNSHRHAAPIHQGCRQRNEAGSRILRELWLTDYSCAPDNPRTYALRLGGLSQRERLGRPARQIWTKRRLPWMPKLEGVPEIEGQP
jgi:hypothetical protein